MRTSQQQQQQQQQHISQQDYQRRHTTRQPTRQPTTLQCAWLLLLILGAGLAFQGAILKELLHYPLSSIFSRQLFSGHFFYCS
jgi:hypothetical protein